MVSMVTGIVTTRTSYLSAEWHLREASPGVKAEEAHPSRHDSREGAMRKTTIALAFLVVWFFAMPTGWAQESDKEHAELAKSVKEAKISLQPGLTANAKAGKPIPEMYDVEHGTQHLC